MYSVYDTEYVVTVGALMRVLWKMMRPPVSLPPARHMHIGIVHAALTNANLRTQSKLHISRLSVNDSTRPWYAAEPMK